MSYPWFEVRPSRERDVSDHPSELVVYWNVNQASVWSLDDRSLRGLRDTLDKYLARVTFGELPNDPLDPW